MTRRSHRRASGFAEAYPPIRSTLFRGGRFQPLNEVDRDKIIACAFSILSDIGLTGTPHWLAQILLERGARLREDGRIVFPGSLVESALVRAAKHVSLPGYREDDGIEIGEGYVHIGTGGAAVQILDGRSGAYREAALEDLYHMMRVLDRSPNIHYGVRPLIARDMPTPLELDINTAYACLRGTGKPIGVSFDSYDHVEPVIRLFDLALGGENRFRKQPFCMAVIVHVVPPLRFAEEGVAVMQEAIQRGMPLQICSAGQAGATSPASLAGALAQGLAESLAGMMVVDALSPGFPCIYAFMPFVSDLRTGAMSGGGGEVAVVNAAAAQIMSHLGLPSTVAAGMTDAKCIDSQAGYEKGYTVALAAQAGADMINLSVGMLGSIMVASPEALVVDDEMCGAILRSVRGVEVRDEFLDINDIERVVTGDGHYLGAPQTLDLMKTEFVYPQLGDRQSVEDWLAAGGSDIAERAHQRVADILREGGPGHLPQAADRLIRETFPIHLPI